MKTERRHELEENQLAEYLQRLWIDIQRYSTAILGTAVALAVVFGAYVYLTGQAKANRALSWELYQKAISTGDDEALLKLGQQFPDLPAGQWAQVTLADKRLAGGVDDLFRDKAEAEKSLVEAQKLYAAARASATREQRDLAERSLLGQARSEEALGRVDDAVKSYRQFVETYPKSPYLIEAEWRLKSLARLDTRKFYDWFAKYQPAPADPTGLFPGTGLLDQLPEEPSADQLLESIEKAAGLGPGIDQPTTTDTPPAEPPLEGPPDAESNAPPTGEPANEPAPAPPAEEPTPQP